MTSRRDFLKKAGLISAAFAVPALNVNGNTTQSKMRLKNTKIAVDDRWDVIVIGGGPAGCTAAISAAREGAKTLLIEAMGQLGGMGTAGMVPAWCPFSDGEKIIYRGLAEKIFEASRKGVPHERKQKMNWVSINPEYLMTVYDQMVTESGARVLFFSRVDAVEKAADETVDAIIVANKSGLVAFKAKVFIDATGDGDVATWAGASFKKGGEDGVLQSSTLCFSFANVDSYNYNLIGPSLHTSNKNSPIFDAIKSGKYPLIGRHFNSNLIGPDVVQYLEAMKDVQPKTFGSAFVVKTASLLGVRDSRRIEGDYTFTFQDWLERKTFEDEIGRNCYYIDVHKPGHKETRYKKGESHGIPYRCLTPKGLKNLLTAGRCISTDEEAFGSLRVMPPCLVTGEAAGMAAVHAIKQTKNDVHKIDTVHLRKRLKEEGQYFL